tara:strand:- start:661 stop:822 length:162 start_codon:yes stop_codon:yes gene_type:complete
VITATPSKRFKALKDTQSGSKHSKASKRFKGPQRGDRFKEERRGREVEKFWGF